MLRSIKFAAAAVGALMLFGGSAQAFTFTVAGVTKDTILNWPIQFPDVVRVTVNPYGSASGGTFPDVTSVFAAGPGILNDWDSPDIGDSGDFGADTGGGSVTAAAAGGGFGSEIGATSSAFVDGLLGGSSGGAFSDWHGINNISDSHSLRIDSSIVLEGNFKKKSNGGTPGDISDDTYYLGARLPGNNKALWDAIARQPGSRA